MATRSTIHSELRRMLAAYPQHSTKLRDDQIADMADVWQEDLADLDDNLLVAACRNHRERSQWLPSIAEIRASAVSLMRQASPSAQTASEAWLDVKEAIRAVGYMRTPDFTNPATAAVVRRMGWRELCLSEDPEGVLRAQFERFYDAEIGRMERTVQQSPSVREFIAGMTAAGMTPQLPEPNGDVGALIKRLAGEKRADA